MGEHADDAINDAIDGSERWGFGWSNRFRGGRLVKTCNHCGETNLHWNTDEDERWILVDNRNVKHDCSPKFKDFIGKPRDPYLQYLDSIPSITEADYLSYAESSY
jgi:hypothetical protein